MVLNAAQHSANADGHRASSPRHFSSLFIDGCLQPSRPVWRAAPHALWASSRAWWNTSIGTLIFKYLFALGAE
jgi:hypothetical protein